MHNIILYLSYCMSCYIIITIIMGYMDGRYKRVFKNKKIYIILRIFCVFGIAVINLFNNAFFSFLMWFLFVGCCSYFLYFDNFFSSLKRVLESETLVFLIAICEWLGAVFVNWFFILLHIKIQMPKLQYCIETACSKIILIFLYYIILFKLIKASYVGFTRKQYIFNIILILHSLIQIIIISDNMAHRPNSFFSVLTLACVVLNVLFLFWFIKIEYRKIHLKYNVKMLEKHNEVQYKYYLRQEKEYNRTIHVLHDVNKHINTIEKLYENGYIEDVIEYTKQIKKTLHSMLPSQYTENPILDILLTDRAVIMSKYDIKFIVNVENVSLDFIAHIDITTIFGNLLDNAIEACKKVRGDKKIIVEISSYYEMISICIKNTFEAVTWKDGWPVSDRGKNHGIGLLNVRHSIEKYDGSMRLREEGTMFVADIFLNT